MPSPTPPVRRVSSTTSGRPVGVASGRTRRAAAARASAGRRRSHPTPSCRQALAQPAATCSSPFPHVTIVRSFPSRCVNAASSGRPRRRVGPSQPARRPARAGHSSCTARSARGRRRPGRGVFAAATTSAASPPRHRPGRTGNQEPGISRRAATRVVVVEVAAEALLIGEPGDPHDHAIGAGHRCEKNWSVAASPRSWSSALITYARYWISGTGKQPGDRRTEREAEDGGHSRAACRRRGLHQTSACRPRVTP